MKANVGSIDKVFRVILGLVIVALGIVFKSWWGVIGIVPLMTAAINFCPLYTIFGISTCKLKKNDTV